MPKMPFMPSPTDGLTYLLTRPFVWCPSYSHRIIPFTSFPIEVGGLGAFYTLHVLGAFCWLFSIGFGHWGHFCDIEEDI